MNKLICLSIAMVSTAGCSSIVEYDAPIVDISSGVREVASGSSSPIGIVYRLKPMRQVGGPVASLVIDEGKKEALVSVSVKEQIDDKNWGYSPRFGKIYADFSPKSTGDYLVTARVVYLPGATVSYDVPGGAPGVLSTPSVRLLMSVK